MTSCTFDPKYSLKHPVNIPTQWNSKDKHYTNKKANLACMAWWHQYHDKDLNRLIALGLRYNNDVNIAMANIEAAEGELKRVRLNWIPTMGGNLGYSSFPYLGYPGVLAAIVPTYTINIFQQIKSQQRAHYELNITQSMRDSVKLAVIAQIAGSYFSYIAEKERLRLIEEVDKDLTAELAIFQSTATNGLTTDIELARAKSELDLIKTEEDVVKNNIVLSQNSLRYLINENPCKFHFKNTFAKIDSHNMLIGSLPVNVIENRPDMNEIISELKASNAGIGVAISNFLPTIQLSAARGDIATVPNGTTLGMPIYFNQALLQQPLITLASFGELDKLRGINKAAYYRYIRTLRQALREVNDNFSAHDLYTKRLDKTVAAKVSTAQAYLLNNDLYQQGIISYLALLDEKIKLDKLKILVNKHKLDQTLTIVNLYQSLALGYNYSPHPPHKIKAKQSA